MDRFKSLFKGKDSVQGAVQPVARPERPSPAGGSVRAAVGENAVADAAASGLSSAPTGAAEGFLCPVCMTSFNDVDVLQAHFESAHSTDAEAAPPRDRHQDAGMDSQELDLLRMQLQASEQSRSLQSAELTTLQKTLSELEAMHCALGASRQQAVAAREQVEADLSRVQAENESMKDELSRSFDRVRQLQELLSSHDSIVASNKSLQEANDELKEALTEARATTLEHKSPTLASTDVGLPANALPALGESLCATEAALLEANARIAALERRLASQEDEWQQRVSAVQQEARASIEHASAEAAARVLDGEVAARTAAAAAAQEASELRASLRRQQQLEQQTRAAQADAAEAALNESLSSLRLALSDAEVRAVDAAQRLADRERHLADVTSELDSARRQLAGSAQELDALRSQLAEVGTEASARRARVAELESQLAASVALGSELQQMADALRSDGVARSAEAEAREAAAQLRLAEVEATLRRELEQSRSALEAELRAAQQRCDDLQREAQQQQLQLLARAAAAAEEASAEREREAQRAAVAERCADELRACAEAERRRLEERLAGAEAAAADRERQVEARAREIDELRSHSERVCHDAATERAQLQSELADAEQRLSSELAASRACDGRRLVAEQAAAGWQQLADELDGELSALRDRLADAERLAAAAAAEAQSDRLQARALSSADGRGRELEELKLTGSEPGKTDAADDGAEAAAPQAERESMRLVKAALEGRIAELEVELAQRQCVAELQQEQLSKLQSDQEKGVGELSDARRQIALEQHKVASLDEELQRLHGDKERMVTAAAEQAKAAAEKYGLLEKELAEANSRSDRLAAEVRDSSLLVAELDVKQRALQEEAARLSDALRIAEQRAAEGSEQMQTLAGAHETASQQLADSNRQLAEVAARADRLEKDIAASKEELDSKAAQAELLEANSRCDRLALDVQDSLQLVNKLKEQQQASQQEASRLSQALQVAEQHAVDASEQMRILEGAQQQASKELVDKATKLTEATARTDQLEKELAAIREEFDLKSVQAVKEKAELELELEQRLQQIVQAEAQYTAVTTKLSESASRENHLMAQAEASSSCIKNLEEQLAGLQVDAGHLQEAARSAEQLKVKAQRKAEMLEVAHNKARELLAGAEARLAESVARVDGLQADLQAAKEESQLQCRIMNDEKAQLELSLQQQKARSAEEEARLHAATTVLSEELSAVRAALELTRQEAERTKESQAQLQQLLATARQQHATEADSLKQSTAAAEQRSMERQLKVDQLEAAVAARDKEVKDAQAQTAAVAARCTQLAQDLEATRKSAMEKEAMAIAQDHKLSELIREKDQYNKLLQQKLAAAAEDHSAVEKNLKADHGKLRKELDEEKDKLKKQTEKAAAMTAEIQKLASMISLKDDAYGKLDKKHRDCVQESESAKEELSKKLVRAEGQLKDANLQLTSLAEARDTLLKTCADQHVEIKRLAATATETEQRADEAAALVETVRSEARTAALERSQMVREHEDARKLLISQKLELQAALEAARHDASSHAQQLRDAAERLADAQAEHVRHLASANAEASAACDEAVAVRARCDAALAESSARVTCLEENVETLRTDLRSAHDKLADSGRLADELRGTLLELEAKLDNSKEDRRILLQRCLDSENMASRLKEEVAMLRRTLEENRAALQEMARENQQLQVKSMRQTTRKWTSDGEARDCCSCAKPFSVTVRRHHCRNCGNIFCNECSSYSATIASSPKPVRVCDSCFQELSSAGGDESSSQAPRARGASAHE